MLKLASHIIEVNDEIEVQAGGFVKAGIKPMDALHLALASWKKANYFCTDPTVPLTLIIAPLSIVRIANVHKTLDNYLLINRDVIFRKVRMPTLNDGTSGEEKESRKARLDLRLTPKEKQILAEAAAHEDMDVSAFVRRTVLTQAQEIIGRAERIRLTKRDFSKLLELLENPPEPSPALKRAVADKYGQR